MWHADGTRPASAGPLPSLHHRSCRVSLPSRPGASHVRDRYLSVAQGSGTLICERCCGQKPTPKHVLLPWPSVLPTLPRQTELNGAKGPSPRFHRSGGLDAGVPRPNERSHSELEAEDADRWDCVRSLVGGGARGRFSVEAERVQRGTGRCGSVGPACQACARGVWGTCSWRLPISRPHAVLEALRSPKADALGGAGRHGRGRRPRVSRGAGSLWCVLYLLPAPLSLGAGKRHCCFYLKGTCSARPQIASLPKK